MPSNSTAVARSTSSDAQIGHREIQSLANPSTPEHCPLQNQLKGINRETERALNHKSRISDLRSSAQQTPKSRFDAQAYYENRSSPFSRQSRRPRFDGPLLTGENLWISPVDHAWLSKNHNVPRSPVSPLDRSSFPDMKPQSNAHHQRDSPDQVNRKQTQALDSSNSLAGGVLKG